MRWSALIAAAVLVAAAAGCGSSSDAGEDATSGGDRLSNRLVDFSLEPPYINGLDVDPRSGDFLLTTNRGFWRIDRATARVTRITGRVTATGRSDTVGTYLEVEPLADGRWLGSGHPDTQNALPEFLGVMESRDAGRTWTVLSRLGEADLHKILEVGGRVYGFDAVRGALLVSSDGGRTFDERFTPRGLIIDFAVDPQDRDRIVAATEDQIFRTEDGGERWRPLDGGQGVRLAWPAGGPLYRADADGTISTSADGQSWTRVGRVDGEPYKFETTDDPDHAYLALSDGTIMETEDGGARWKAAFRP